jgi:hypothetical protein
MIELLKNPRHIEKIFRRLLKQGLDWDWTRLGLEVFDVVGSIGAIN